MKTVPLSCSALLKRRLKNLHLFNQATGGFPRGEPVSLAFKPHKKGHTAGWTFNQTSREHQIAFYDGILAYVPETKPGEISGYAASAFVEACYQHERGHAILTDRNHIAISKAVKEGKIPFVLWNAFEDVRIEYRMAVRFKTYFSGWDKLCGRPVPVDGDFSKVESMFPFIFAYKNAMGDTLHSLAKRGYKLATVPHRSARLTRNLVHKKSAWAGALRTPVGTAGGSPLVAMNILEHVRETPSTMALIPLLKRWLELFPWPIPPEADGSPGEPSGKSTGETTPVDGVNKASADKPEPGPSGEPSGSPSGDPSDSVNPQEQPSGAELNDEAEVKKQIEKIIHVDSAKGGEGTGSDENAPPVAVHAEKHEYVAGFPSVNPTATPNMFNAEDGYSRLQHFSPYRNGGGLEDKNVTKYDKDGEETYRQLRNAIPGENGKRFTSNPGENVNVERYIERSPEMFTDNKGPRGTGADIICVIDGSGSMRGPWETYGRSIANALIKMHTSGSIRRLRIMISARGQLLTMENPNAEILKHISPCSGSEGLWIAYEEMVKRNWIERDTHLFVITDGDVVDVAPNKAALNAAGGYPIAVYMGDPSATNYAKTTAFFDIFIVRPTLAELVDEIARLF